MKTNDRKWKEFLIGGVNGIFDIESTSSGIDKNKLIFHSEDKKIPYITRSERNNGIMLFVTSNQKKKYSLDKGNVITIGLDTQTVFYQAHKFFTGQNIQVLRHSKLNEYNALFIIPLIRIQMEKFNWGGNGATLGRLFKTKLMLPVDDKEKPDWDFMEKYIRLRTFSKEKEYDNFLKVELSKLSHLNILPLNDKVWVAFNLIDIFPSVQRGKRLTKANQMPGSIPYISSTSINNGINNFISNNVKVRKFKDCLTIANSGSVGVSFYHGYEFVASDHVTHLKNDAFNKYIYLFIATLTNRLSFKYNFNREINDKRISKERILLPVNENNEPDYDYMESFSKNLIVAQYKKYNRRELET